MCLLTVIQLGMVRDDRPVIVPDAALEFPDGCRRILDAPLGIQDDYLQVRIVFTPSDRIPQR